ncbi:hypothetical protein Ethha_2035 [Ethanoligenens harbinense YUAN-3]|uniref:Uncharacterized protein n=1 Tax=Ethanoligenens harbinense (strain DSM 18485 / JCM 12961 / CGMCC 1.5033 / YUAN-3) TaxID=663278 RepID=E6U380_ETHHY|nr:hypothetical protein Ethha_2035 [Ethanoligenens harbinense YUAN-3]
MVFRTMPPRCKSRWGVQNLGAALSLPAQTGDLSAVSNLDADVSGLYTESQLPAYRSLFQTGIDSKPPLSGIGRAQLYAQSQYTAQQLGLTVFAGSVNRNAVAGSMVQLHQNDLNSSFPGAVFSGIA